MSVKTWTATNTGLPCIYSDEDVTVTAPGGRILHLKGDGAPFAVSDAMAVPGMAGEYQIGGVKKQISRATSTMGTQILTPLNGRGVPGLGAQPVEDQPDWKSDVKIHETGAVRFSLHRPPREGSIRVLLHDPTRIDDVWNVLWSKSPVIVSTGAPVPGVYPMMVAVINDVKQERAAHWGLTRFHVSFTEHMSRLNATAAYRAGLSGAAPVVTWGEWQVHDGGWTHKSYVQLAREIAGMPA